MKRISLLVVVVAGLVALPGSAGAAEGCQAGTVYTDGGLTADDIVGVCVDTGNSAFYGGTLEVGNGGPGTYATIDGDDRNDGQAGGYGALSNYENGGKDECTQPADQTDEGSGTNSGGCFSVRSGPSSSNPVLISLPVPLLACGNTSGPSFNNAGRDGCTIP